MLFFVLQLKLRKHVDSWCCGWYGGTWVLVVFWSYAAVVYAIEAG